MDHGLVLSPLVHGPMDSVHRVFFRKIIRMVIDFPWHLAIKPLTFSEIEAPVIQNPITDWT
jgi:hypothetical protein